MPSNTNPTFHPSALAAVNQALVVLGQDIVLTELSTTSKQAESRKAAYVYESARQRVLRDHPWAFARREQAAPPYTVVPSVHSDALGYRTPKPPRMTRLVGCFDCTGRMAQYRLDALDIRSDRPLSRIVWTADVEDLDKWSPDAYRALVLRLAADLAKPITGRINERQLQEQAYADVLANAKLHDAQEANVDYDAYGSNHYVDMMFGGRPRREDIFRR